MDLHAVNVATRAAMDKGIRVLNAFMLDASEDAHVRRLLDLMKPPHGATVVDAGCGIGEVALVMRRHRPDLRFKLVNISAEQLALCPEGMERLHADYTDTGIASESADVVMFNYALCHAYDWLAALTEARRILKEGGVLFISDMVRSRGDNTLMEKLAQAAVFHPCQVDDVARRAGFVSDEALIHTPAWPRLRDTFADKALYDIAFDGILPATFRFIRKTTQDEVASAFERHERIAFQFSGGRDSTAALYLLRPYWSRMTVYHLDTGDQFPETREVVARVEQDVPIVRIASDVEQVRREFGLASDVVPVDNTDTGQLVSGREVRIIGRYECCARALMVPMHQRMKQDGITLIIRGQRDDEYATPPKRSGEIGDGMEVLYPIQSWTGDQVSAYLKERDLPLAQFYERGARRAPECMGCTAWWDEGRAAYLREWHPVAFRTYRDRMRVIRAEIDRQMATCEF